MTTSELVRKLCEEQNISLSELARRTGQTRQNLGNKLKRNSISISELQRIAEAVGMEFEPMFTRKES